MADASLLQQPATTTGRAALQAILDDPAGTLVATDFDGVLAEIIDDPEQASADEQAMTAVRRIAAHVGAVVVITGRAAATVVRLGKLRNREGLDRLVVLGQYGVERWDAATDVLDDPPPPAGIDELADELSEMLVRFDLTGVRIEDKVRARVLHARGLPDPGAALARLREPVGEIAGRYGLAVEPGKNVLEIRAPGQDKGRALRAVMSETGARSVIYLGDDLGDLPAFAAIRDLADSGVPAVGVCSASVEEDALVEVSDLVVDGVPGVAAWLTALADELDTRAAAR